VSGSGKSSVVFDTIATEAQRQLYENFSLFVRSFLPRYPQPDADGIENLSMAVIVDQKRLGGGSHSTVGTITDIYTLLRLLFSRVGKPAVGAALGTLRRGARCGNHKRRDAELPFHWSCLSERSSRSSCRSFRMWMMESRSAGVSLIIELSTTCIVPVGAARN